jgi:hypothetical protein
MTIDDCLFEEGCCYKITNETAVEDGNDVLPGKPSCGMLK